MQGNPLAETDRPYRLLVEAVVDYAIYLIDLSGRIASWNPGARRLKGYEAEEVIGQHFSIFFTEEDRRLGRPEAALETARRHGRFEAEGWRVRKDGSRFWALAVLDAVRDRDGNVIGFAKVTRDMTERREAQQALMESERRFRLLVQGVTDYAIFMLDPAGRVANWNAGARRIKGWAAEEIVGQHFSRFYTEEDRAAGVPQRALEQAERTGRFEAEGWRVRKDGSRFWASVVIHAIRDHEGGEGSGRGALVGFAKVTRDITEKRDAEWALETARGQLAQAQKMEAIGQLTGGVAHDFNNMLQAITGNLHLIRRRLRDERPDVARLADNGLDAAAKAAGLTSQLLAFARRQRLEPQPLDPAEVAEGMRGLLARTAGARIALRIEAEEGTGLCLADRNQLESALLNLAINARDAIGDAPGTVTVSLRAERVEATPGDWTPAGEYVRIAVRDDGPGMPEEVRRRAFEPFFTTKGPGKGSGLGLAQIHGFAHQSGGTARIESAPGTGTEVSLLLPRTGEARREATEVHAAAEPEAGHGETVLVVEDDALVRTALAETLRDLRYRVVEAADADAALAMLDTGTRVSAVLTDLTMPGSMDGLGLAAATRARLPAVPVILISGHLAASQGKSLPPGVEFVQKPHTGGAIAAALRRALGGTAVLVRS